MTQLQQVAKSINKLYGEGTITDPLSKQFRIPTGIFNLDATIGGGVAMGSIHLFVGKESGGKTFTALKTISNGQLIDRETKEPLTRTEEGIYIRDSGEIGTPLRAAFIDVEGATTPHWARKIGVDTNPEIFIMSKPNTLEKTWDIAKGILKSGAVDILVIDSLAAMASMKELEKSAEDATIALSALGNNRGLRAVTSLVNGLRAETGYGPAVIIINQLRLKTGIVYGSPITYPGGEGQKFVSDLTVEFSPSKAVYLGKGEKEEESVGMGSTWTIRKNKLNGVRGSGAFTSYHKNVGLYRAGDVDVLTQVLATALRLEIIQQAGAWFTYTEHRFQGKAQVEEFMLQNPSEFKNLQKAVIRRIEENNS